MPGLLIIAHAPLASSLKAVAQHTFPEAAAALQALDVSPEMVPEAIEAQARELLQQVRNPEAVIFTDVFGATQGVMQVAVSRPQNQASKTTANDQVDHHDQQ